MRNAVGAGAAGIPASARLSEDPDVNVCLFEAGPTDRRNVAIETPKFWPGIGFHPGEILWNHTTVPQRGLKDRSILTSTARVIGGSTSHNAMLYFRGFKNDFDSWAANGAKGWSYRDVMPYYSKLENLEIPHARPDCYVNQKA
ncbi:hypothetical protein KUTeg_010724 [Tegillarca granosa]|uniref:Glucose-methanol-choline oxidoreductase N-terminal domain-containing protein n=1 Tax=Tegillarca granosa TaxID=220873 RepID=A0ABQ9F210_TEGGR|nr:hypothetical protein KUTeg_010724 [Tegillarca granosa]